MDQGPKTEWYWRYHFPKPGGEAVHARWRQWLYERNIWPSEAQLLDETYQMMMPSDWRRTAYKGLTTLDEFFEVQNNRIQRGVTWNQRAKRQKTE